VTGGMIFLADGMCHPSADLESSDKVVTGKGSELPTVARLSRLDYSGNLLACK
jgi:hypothetical protein